LNNENTGAVEYVKIFELYSPKDKEVLCSTYRKLRKENIKGKDKNRVKLYLGY
jgi:hypothetical protein